MIICLLIPLGAASASDINNTADNQVLSATPSVDTLSASVNPENNNDTQSVQNNENLLSAGSDSGSELLKENEPNAISSFNVLSKLIKYTPNKLTITEDFKFDSSTDANNLIISKDNYEIDFNNHTLDFSNVFNQITINGHNVTIKNVKIINTKSLFNLGTATYSGRTYYYYSVSGTPIVWKGDNGIVDHLDLSNSTGGIQFTGNNGLVNNSYIHDSKYRMLYGNVNLYNSHLYNISESDMSNLVSTSPDNPSYYMSSIYCIDVVNCYFDNVGRATVQASGSVYNSTFINGGRFSAKLFKNCTFDGLIGYKHIFRNNNLISGNLDNCTIKNMNESTCNGISTIFASALDGQYDKIKVINVTSNERNTNGGFLFNAPIYGLHDCEFINVTAYHFSRNTGQMFLYDCYFENVTFTDNGVTVNDGEHIVKNSKFVNVTGAKAIFYLNKDTIKFTLINSSFEFPEDKEYDGWLATLTDETRHLNVDDATMAMIYNKTAKAIVPDTWDDTGMNNIYASEFGVENGDGKSNETPVSLKYALSIANTDAVIHLVNNGTPWSNESGYYINKRITIDGNNVTFQDIKSEVFDIRASSAVINNINLIKCGDSTVSAPIYFSKAQNARYYGLTFNDCMFINNTGKSAGVAIEGGYQKWSQNTVGLTFNRCDFINNSAVSSENLRKLDTSVNFGRYSSGAIVAHNSLNVVNCTFINNTGLYSGAIAVTDGLANITGTNFTNNSINKTASVQYHPQNSNLPIDAGALWIYVNGAVDGCKFDNNTAPMGGAITMGDGLINNTKFINNNASFNQGGAIFALNINSGINNCTFYNNSANTTGGAIYTVTGNDVVISNSTFECNNASSGSAIHTQAIAGTLSLIDSNFTNNTNQVIDLNKKNLVINGGYYTDHTGGLINGSSSMTIDNAHFINNGGAFNASVINNTGVTNIMGSYFINNTAANNMLYLQGTSNIENSEFINNTVDGIAVVYLGGDKSIVTDSVFTNNSVVNGTLYFAGDGILVKGSTFNKNNASLYGGAIYIEEGLYYSVAANTVFNDNKCNVSGLADKQLIGVYADTGAPYNYHKIYDFKAHALLYDVFVVAHPEDFNSNETGDELNPVNLTRALKIVNDEGILHFMHAGDVFSELDSYSDIKIGLIFEGNNTTINGSSFIVNNPNVKFHNITFANASNHVIMINASNVEIIDCNFEDNDLEKVSYGACIVVNGNDFNLKNTTFSNNKVSDKDTDVGGMVLVNASGTNIFNVTFNNNSGIVNGIVFTSAAESVFLENSSFSNSTKGSVLSISGLADVNVINNKFDNNSCTGYGGGIIVSDSECFMLNIVNNTFFLNNALNGGAVSFINNYAQRIIFTNNNFSNNTATSGGALFINEPADFSEVHNNNFYNNTANYGGAIYNNGVLVDRESRYIGNVATSDGGAIYNNNTLSLNSNDFNGNGAVNGGAIYNNGVLVDTGSVYVYNNATRDGGAIYSKSDLDYTAASSSSRDFIGNRAVNGGALYINGTNNNIRGALFTGNIANYGSCIYVENNTDLNVYGTSIADNHVANGSQATGGHGDIYLGNVVNFAIPDDGLYLEPQTTGSSTYDQYIYNSTNMVRSDVLYVSESGTGLGLISSEPTTLDKALEAINDNGRIIFVESYMLNSPIINRNVTLAGYNNTISMKRNNTTDKNKYLFNPLKKIKNLSLNNYLSS